MGLFTFLVHEEAQCISSPGLRIGGYPPVGHRGLQLETKTQSEIEGTQANDNHDGAAKLEKLNDQLQSLIVESASFSSDGVTDDRFKLEGKKCKIAQGFFELTASKRIDAAKQTIFRSSPIRPLRLKSRAAIAGGIS